MIERFFRWIDTVSDGDDTAVLTTIVDIILVISAIVLFIKNF